MRCVVSCGSTSFPWLVFFLGALIVVLVIMVNNEYNSAIVYIVFCVFLCVLYLFLCLLTKNLCDIPWSYRTSNATGCQNKRALATSPNKMVHYFMAALVGMCTLTSIIWIPLANQSEILFWTNFRVQCLLKMSTNFDV